MSDDSVSDLSNASPPAPRSGADAETTRTATVDAGLPNAPAIPDDTVQRYYYVYDSRAGRPLVEDRLTNEPYVWEEDPRAPVLRHAASSTATEGGSSEDSDREDAESEWSPIYRRFALWCARHVADAIRNGSSPPDAASVRALGTTDELIEDVEALVESPSREQAALAPGDAENAIIHACTIGLSEMDPAAAALLTAFGATHPDPRMAALEAAHMSERFAEFVAFHRQNGADTPLPASVSERHDRRPGSREDTPAPDAAARLMREAQIDWLLDEV